MTNFEKDIQQMFKGIELCLKEKLQFPTLSLIYTIIDNLAYIAYGDIGVEKRYKKWITEYMFKEKNLNVTPMDLYSARCAILHTLTPNSKKTNEKKAFVITYAWGNYDVNILEKSISYSNQKFKALHINDLYDSLVKGTIKFFNSDILKEKECLKRMDEHYGKISKEILIKYNDSFK
ncbi:hypothetical protein [Aliarcobacter butzleri]|uniref:hypothetical protein n=1 Tax=Aliarcobacter butzleri TaxID=28197 RepID=UPI00062E8940|nr:hypothetical protein [Aliarcobacter butzleri]KLD96025.1 hypothetical protein AF74_11235 [Aliarcobacter butzleri L349]MCR8709756.1 hypothetical protein [Aliarcobacter butzleri]